MVEIDKEKILYGSESLVDINPLLSAFLIVSGMGFGDGDEVLYSAGNDLYAEMGLRPHIPVGSERQTVEIARLENLSGETATQPAISSTDRERLKNAVHDSTSETIETITEEQLQLARALYEELWMIEELVGHLEEVDLKLIAQFVSEAITRFEEEKTVPIGMRNRLKPYRNMLVLLEAASFLDIQQEKIGSPMQGQSISVTATRRYEQLMKDSTDRRQMMRRMVIRRAKQESVIDIYSEIIDVRNDPNRTRHPDYEKIMRVNILAKVMSLVAQSYKIKGMLELHEATKI